MSKWISVDERLPDVEHCYCLVTRHYHSSKERPSVHYSFFTKSRELARKNNQYYSRKYQGKNSVHFEAAESGFVVTHWMELPKPAELSE